MKERHARGPIKDAVLVTAVASLVAAGCIAFAFLPDLHRVSLLWLFAAVYAAVTGSVEARGMRSGFRRPLFLPFFIVCLAGQVAVVTWANWWFGLGGVALAILGSIFVFGCLTYLLFGPVGPRATNPPADSETSRRDRNAQSLR